MLTAATALSLSLAAGVAMPDAPTLKPSAALPLAAHLLDAHNPDGIAGRSDDQLADLVRVTLGRVQLDDEHLVFDDPQDVQDLVTLAAALEALSARGVDAPGLRRAAVYAAYGCHALGTAYETQAATRASVDRLPSLAQGPGSRELLTQLAASVRGMRALGRAWFPVALHRALDDDAKAAILHNLRGLWLAREGRHAQAADAFRQAIAVSPKADFGVHLYDELLTLAREAGADGDTARRRALLDEAKALADKVTAGVPGAAGRLQTVARRHEDEEAAAAYDAPGARRDAASGAEQVARLTRLGRGAQAEELARALLAQYPKAPAALHAAAEVFALGRRYEDLAALCARAEEQGILDQRLLEARVAAHAQARMDHLMRGGAKPPAALGDLRADLTRYAALAGPAGDETARALRLLLATADALRAKATGAQGAEGRVALALKMAQDALAAHPTSAATVRVAVGASLSLQAPDKAMALLASRLPKLAPAERAPMILLLARMELGYGARRRDGALMDRGLGRLAGLTVEGAQQQAVLRYTRLVAPVARAALAGTREAVEDAARAVAEDLGVPSVLEGLMELDRRFDRSTEEGRRNAMAVALSAGALAVARNYEGLARVVLKKARYYAGGEDPLGLLADGQAQVADGDLAGAFGRLTRAAALATRPAVRFAARKWLILAANKAGDARAAQEVVGPLLEDWGPAKIPDRVEAGVPLPVFAGDFQVNVGVAHGEPLSPQATASPLLLLVPDFPAERAWFVGLRDKLRGLGGDAER